MSYTPTKYKDVEVSSTPGYPIAGSAVTAFTGFITNNAGGDAQIGANAQTNGADLRVSLDGGSTFVTNGQLQYYYLDGSNNAFFLYAFNYNDSGSGITPRLYYGDGSAVNADSTSTWDTNTKLAVSATDITGTLSVADKSGNQTFSANTATLASGVIGKALQYNGSSQNTQLTSALSLGSSATLSCWFNNAALGKVLISAGSFGWAFPWFNTSNTGIQVYDSVSYPVFTVADYVTGGGWHKVTLVLSGGNGYVYLDGVASSSNPTTTASGPIQYLGNFSNAAYFFGGAMAFTRADTTNRTAAWDKLDYDIISKWADGTLTLGAQQNVGGTNYPLDGASGSFALTGTAASLDVGVTGASGSFTMTGTASTLGVGVAGASGSFSLTGTAAALDVGVTGASGSFSLTGTDATIDIGMTGSSGAFAVTGTAASLTPSSPSSVRPFFGGRITSRTARPFLGGTLSARS